MEFIQTCMWAVLIIYAVSEMILSIASGMPLALLIYIIREVFKAWLGKNSCMIGLHRWTEYTERHKATGVPGQNQSISIQVYKRKCEGKCGKKQYCFNSPRTYMFNGWKTGTLNKKVSFEKTQS